MKTLDEALLLLQRIHGLVEQYAIALKRNQSTSAFVHEHPPAAADARGEPEEAVRDDLRSGDGGEPRRPAAARSEVVRLRQLREGVAQIKQAIEIAMTQTKDKHKVIEKSRAAQRRGRRRVSCCRERPY